MGLYIITEAFVTEAVLKAFIVIGIIVTTLIALSRAAIRILIQRQLFGDDFALFCAWAFNIVMAILTLVYAPQLYKLLAWAEYAEGLSEADLEYSYRLVIIMELVDQFTFWCSLWAVKLSLLLSFRRIVRLTNWLKVWWVVLGFTVLTWAGCMVTGFTSCKDVKHFLELGVCERPEDHGPQIASLYTTFACDVATDIVIMILPIRVIWGLQMSRREKYILASLFGSQAITVIVSAIRVFLIVTRASDELPSPTWIALWNSIECMTAIITGSIPALSTIFRNHENFGLKIRIGRSCIPVPKTWLSDSSSTDLEHSISSRWRRSSKLWSPFRRRASKSQSELDQPEPLYGIMTKTEIIVQSEKAEMPTQVDQFGDTRRQV